VDGSRQVTIPVLAEITEVEDHERPRLRIHSLAKLGDINNQWRNRLSNLSMREW
jgi:hypothetical protein